MTGGPLWAKPFLAHGLQKDVEASCDGVERCRIELDRPDQFVVEMGPDAPPQEVWGSGMFVDKSNPGTREALRKKKVQPTTKVVVCMFLKTPAGSSMTSSGVVYMR